MRVNDGHLVVAPSTSLSVHVSPRSGPERSDFALWRNPHLQPKTAFSRLPSVHEADLESPLRVDSTLS
jgi:hypothetical protein